MENKRLVELAIEGLRAKRDAIELEIQALSKGLRAAVSTLRGSPKPAAAPKRKKRSAAVRKAQAERMRAYWAKRKAEAAKQPKKAAKPKKAKAAQAVPF